MKRISAFVIALTITTPAALGQGAAVYFPGPGDDWQRKRPEEVQLDGALLQQAIDFAIAGESTEPRDLALRSALSIGGEPFDNLVGPTRERGPLNGIILRHGYIVAEWGDTKRVDMTFSVTKSYLSTTAGLAFDRGLIRNVNDFVKDYVSDGGFDSPHNAKITWHHLLNQTSAWEGTMWGKPDWADRPEGDRWEWHLRKLPEPGARFKYNDVRVNRLALALLRIWRKPLPLVLREEVMDKIGASKTWEWHGYENSWVTIDGLRMQSVSGGGHWGGGMMINTRDHARFGLLSLRRGKWKDQQILSERWVRMATTPGTANPNYGYMNWYLNTGRRPLPAAPETAFYHSGAGSNLIYVDPVNDIVAVVRWIQGDKFAGFVERILAAVKDKKS